MKPLASLLLFLILSFGSYAQNEVKFDDGTLAQFKTFNDNPRVRPNYYLIADLGPVLSLDNFDEMMMSIQLRGAWQLQQKLQLHGYFHIAPQDLSFNTTSLGFHYQIKASEGNSKTRIPIKSKVEGEVVKRYWLKRPMLHWNSLDLYAGYSRRGIAPKLGLDGNYLNPRIDDGLIYTSFHNPDLTVHSIDLGFSLSQQKLFDYSVDQTQYHYFSFIRSTVKVHIPIARSVAGDLSFLDPNTGIITNDQRRENLDILDDILEPIGFSLDNEYLISRGRTGRHWIQNLGLEIGYYPFLENERIYVRLYTGIGYKG